MKIADSLFAGEHICLAPIDHEKDPEIESKWTHDAGYMRMLSPDPVRPLSAARLKKKYESIEKEQDESRNSFYFTIRMREDDRLIGFAHLSWIEWTNGNAWIRMGIGEADARGHGYGSQALDLLLRYAFAELNLYRLTISIPEYNVVALHVAQKAGFVEEVRRRQALNRDGKRWEMLQLGILRQEWEQRTSQA
jgi:RimJ/RimL family protein N-acetyltransferase